MFWLKKKVKKVEVAEDIVIPNDLISKIVLIERIQKQWPTLTQSEIMQIINNI